jgi:hypothetical protein
VSLLGSIRETECDSCAHTLLLDETGETVLSWSGHKIRETDCNLKHRERVVGTTANLV